MQGPGTFLDVATYPPGATEVDARIVIDGDRGAIFVYQSGNPLGNLVGSWAATAGTDPYGNAYPEGFNGLLGVIQGVDFISIFQVGSVWYKMELNEGQITFSNGSSNTGPWTVQATISLYNGSNVGGITLTAPTILLKGTNTNGGIQFMPGNDPAYKWQRLEAWVQSAETRISQTTLQPSTYLSQSTLAPGTYAFECVCLFDAASGVNFQWDFGFDGGGTCRYSVSYHSTGGTLQHEAVTTTGATPKAAQTTGAGTSNLQAATMIGTYYGGSGGTFELLFAQNTSSSNTLSLRDGSRLSLWRIP